MNGEFTNLQDIRKFVVAGKATFTIVSRASGTRFTYRITAPRNSQSTTPIWFVSVLTGPDNTNDYRYFGNIYHTKTFRIGAKSKISSDASSVKGFIWFWNMLQSNNPKLLDQCNVYHQGKCGACGRALTVPQSIEIGLGPMCASK